MESLNQDPLFGKYSARVAEDGADDDGRVLVELTAILNDGEPAKMRAMPCFSPGVFFLPRKGDEVWVEFEGGDPRKPIWSGVHRRTGGKGSFKAAKGDEGAVVIQCGDSTIVMKKDSIELKCGETTLVLDKDQATVKTGQSTFELKGSSAKLASGQSSLALEPTSFAAACVQHKLEMDMSGTTITSQAGVPSPIFLNPKVAFVPIMAHVHLPPVSKSEMLTPLMSMISILSSK